MLTVSERSVQRINGSRNPGLAAIDWNVGVGEKNVPMTRPIGEMDGACAAGTGSALDMAPVYFVAATFGA
jgi:hypothetical protein